MKNLTLDYRNTKITLEADTEEQLIATLDMLNLSEQVSQHFYFSQSENKRTGNGWLLISDMNSNFILNAITAKLREMIVLIFSEKSSDNQEEMLLVSLQNLNDSLLFNCESDNVKLDRTHTIVSGLIAELDRRLLAKFDATVDDQDDY